MTQIAQTDRFLDVTGRNFLATGAGGALGSAIVRALVERGAHVVITDIDGDKAASVVSTLDAPGRAESDCLDIRDERAVDVAIDGVIDRYGRLDGVINAAGVFRLAPIPQLTTEDLRSSLECNFTGPFFLTKAAGRVLGSGGRILHIASVSSLVANPNYAAYASTKAALSQLVRVAARELAPKGIAVNAIGPALTETPLTSAHLTDDDFRKNATAQIPMGRLGEPEDIVPLALLLLAPGGSFITGQTIYADGGRTLV